MSITHRRLRVSGDNADKYLLKFRSRQGTVVSELLVKQYRAEWVQAAVVENEFRGLQYASGVLARTARFRTPHPYGWSAEHKLLVMEYCPGYELSYLTFSPVRFSRFWMPAASRGVASGAVTAVGQLLAAFQGAGEMRNLLDTDSSGALSRYRALFIKNFRTHERMLPQSLRTPLERAVMSGLTGSSVLRLVPEHHDFGPWNVTVGHRYWYLLDFGNFEHGCPEYDLSGFVVALGLLGRHRMVDQGVVADLQTRFIESFCDEWGGRLYLDSKLFRVFALMHLIELASVGLRRASIASLALLRPAREFFANQFEDYLTGQPTSVQAVQRYGAPAPG